MHPHGYAENFYWPSRDDNAYVPFSKVLVRGIVPKPLSSSGRQYSLSKTDIESTEIAFQKSS